MVFTVGPDRTDGVNDPGRFEFMAAGDLRVTGLAAAQRPAFFEKRGTRSFMDRTIHAAAAQKTPVGRVHDRIHAALCDIPLDDGDTLSQFLALASFKICPILAD